MMTGPPFGRVSARVQHLRNHASLPGPLERAYLRCLNRDELLALTWWFVDRAVEPRSFHAALLRGPLQETFQKDERAWAKWLTSLVRGASYQRQLRAAYYIQLLADCFPIQLRSRVLSQLLGSPKSGVRARGLRQLQTNWNHSYAAAVEKIWREHGDRESAKLIIARFEQDFLAREFDTLADAVPRSKSFLELCVRVADTHPGTHERILEHDPITYLYVMGESGSEVPASLAREIYLEYRADYRCGVILWALGKLGHWELLREIEDREAGETTPIWRGF